MPDPCPSAADLGRCLRGELTPAEAARVEEHVGGCHACQAALEQVTRPAPPPLGAPPDIPGFTLLNDGKAIGEGGMGEVFRAVEAGIGREVAVKIIHRSHANSPHRLRLVRRFEEEVKLLGRIQHAGVPPVYRFGWAGDDQPYLVMRLIPWPTLGDELAGDWAPGAGGPAPDRLNQYLVWFSRTCEAVGYAHDHGAVHLDLKPANVKVHRSGEVQVLDWGLGRGFMATPDGRTRLFSESAVEAADEPVGHTAAYSPPEQVRGGHPDPKMHPRADVFALGSVLCEILTGRPAFHGATPEERFNKAYHGDLTDARARLAAAGRRHPLLAALALRCLAPDPLDRPADAGVVAAEVRRVVLSAEDRLRTARWRYRLGATVAAAAVLAAATAGWVAYRTSEHERIEAEAKLAQSVADQKVAALAGQIEETRQKEVEAAARGHLDKAAAAVARTGKRDFAHPEVRDDEADTWVVAVREVRAADDAITGKAVGADLTERVKRAVKEVEGAAAAFAADRALLDALDVARARKVSPPDPDPQVVLFGAYFFSRGGAEEFPKAFALAGLYPQRESDRQAVFVAAVRDRHERVRGPVVAALDQWYLLTRSPQDQWLLDLADRLDPERDRKRVREAVRGGRAEVKKLLATDPALAAGLSPEAALLAAAGLEDWRDWRAAEPNPRPGPGRGIDEAIALLRPVADRLADAADRRAAAYWVHLTLGFYLAHSAGEQNDWSNADRAVPRLTAAEALIERKLPIDPSDRSPTAVLKVAAGGFRAYTQARRSGPGEVEGLVRAAVRDYPGYSPAWQLAVLVKFDRGDERGAAETAADWRRWHDKSAVAEGYAILARALVTTDHGDAAVRLGQLSRRTNLSAIDRLQILELWGLMDPGGVDLVQADKPEVAHPNRAGGDVVMVLDARDRADRALAPVGPRTAADPDRPGGVLAFRPWRLQSPDRSGDRDRLGRSARESWSSPREAVDGYERAARAAPWATGPVYGKARALLAAGVPDKAAEVADGLIDVPGALPRPVLFKLFLARAHTAAAEWAEAGGQAAEHRRRAAAALAVAVAADPRTAPLASAVDAEAVEAGKYAAILTGEEPTLPPREMCDRAETGIQAVGHCWVTVRLAGQAFIADTAFARNPFPARDATAADKAVVRCAVLAAWGYRGPAPAAQRTQVRVPFAGVPPDVRLKPLVRISLLGKVRERVQSAAGSPLRDELLADPVVAEFVKDVARRVPLPAPDVLSEAEARAWLLERREWVEFLVRINRLPVRDTE